MLLCLANPDGMELVANWYMREPDETKRSIDGVPRLWQKYVGHDNARDMYMSNHAGDDQHQQGAVHRSGSRRSRTRTIRRDPQAQSCSCRRSAIRSTTASIRSSSQSSIMVGAAMHSRLIAKGMPGSAMRGAANYSTWWNGGDAHDQLFPQQ